MITVSEDRSVGVDLLKQRIGESGLSARRFALEVLRRDERTIRRWLASDSPIPRPVLDFLENPVGSPWPGPTAETLIASRSEVWLRSLYRGDIASVRHMINPSHVGDWLSDFPIPDELREYTLRTLGQTRQCLNQRNRDGACAAILAIRRRWRCGPTSTPTLGDFVST